MGHLARRNPCFDSPHQTLQHHLTSRLGKTAPEFLELQRRMLILAARGGAVVRGSDIDFLLEIELLADTSQRVPSKPSHR
jgi:hypothetical protein